ncbi:MAG: hypothetical protein AAF514_00890 [Verrucomicrobiota bacterium]
MDRLVRVKETLTEGAAGRKCLMGRALFWIFHLVFAGGFSWFSGTVVAKCKLIIADMLPGQPLPALAQLVFTANQPFVPVVFVFGLAGLSGLILAGVRPNTIAFGTAALLLLLQVAFFGFTLLGLHLTIAEIVSGIEGP